MDKLEQFIRGGKWSDTVSNVVVLTIISYFLLLAGETISYLSANPKYSFFLSPLVSAPEAIKVAAFLFFLFFIFLSDSKFAVSINKGKDYKFKAENWLREWISNGSSYPNAEELHIQSSRAGCLLQDYSWKNCVFTFEMRFQTSFFRPMKNIGIIFRAKDLDNYFMLEIFQDNYFNGQAKSGIKPHVRFEGGWEALEIQEYDFDLSKIFHKIVLKIKDDRVYVQIENQPEWVWMLPTHVDIMFRDSGSQPPKTSNNEDLMRKDAYLYVQEIPFRSEYGMIGFRAHPGQGAVVKNLEIKHLK